MDISKLFGRKTNKEKEKIPGESGNVDSVVDKKDETNKDYDTSDSAMIAGSVPGRMKKSKTVKINTGIGKKNRKQRSNRTVHTKRSFHKKSGRSLQEQVHIYDVIERPVVTEKSADKSQQGVYAFYTRKSATKHTIADAVEVLYGVRPIKIRIARKPARMKRIRVTGRERETSLVGEKKKAYVFLKKGDTIKLT